MDLTEWESRAACFNHAFLPPDAWGGMKDSGPTEEGADAWLVCTFVCPVKRECAAKFRGADIIAGGGWFKSDGTRVMPDPEFMDPHRAAAYLGVEVTRMRIWGRRLKTHIVNGRQHYETDDIVELSRRPGYGPQHGTYRAWRLHKLRGEPVCDACLMVEVEEQALQPVA